MPKQQPMNLKGRRIGDLLVLQRVRSKGRPKWRCECLACGGRVTVAHYRLIHKDSPKTHCGCKRKGLPTRYKEEYHAWWDAKSRCHNPNHPSYPQYGAKGIRMCNVWRESFELFLEHIGPRPFKTFSLDRINPHGAYEPGNVRWASTETQARNKKRSKYVAHPRTGRRVPAAEAARDMGMKYQTFRKWMIERGKW